MIKAVVGILTLFSFVTYSQVESPINGLTPTVDSTSNYSFIVSGHFYGGSSNTTGYPTNTLLANLDWINQADATMLVCLGDLFMDVKNDIPKYESSLFTKLELPLINAVGNHDITGSVYQDNFGSTHYNFELGNDLHIVLDTEMDNGDIDSDQLKLIEDALNKKYDNVFIYSHRTIWKGMYNEMDGIFEDNTQSLTGSNYESEVYPLLEKISEKSNVYWFSGSLGDAPASFFRHNDGKVTYIATAIRGLPRDAMLEVSVNNGAVNFTTKSLTGKELLALDEYDIDYWQSNSSSEPFNWRLLPLYIKQTLLSWSFLFGGLTVLLLGSLIILIKRKRRKRLKPSD